MNILIKLRLFIISTKSFLIFLAISLLAIGSILISGLAHAAGVAFVQVVAAQPTTSQSTVTVKYTKAQTAGDTNVLAIGWSDATSSIASVSDSAGNTYAVAAPMVRGTTQSQAIYYAANIKASAANANTVTVTFNTAAQYVDLRASEYSGLDPTAPLDKIASASGTTSSVTTPSVTTTYNNELIFGAGDTSGGFTAVGSGFTKRIITSPDADITEDKTVSAIGSNSVTATQTGSWVMQMVTFKAAGATSDTTPPSVPTGLSAAAASQTQVNLSWTASTDNVGVAGYKIFRNGTQVGTSTTTTYSDTGLSAGTTYTYTVSAYDAAGNVSAQSTAASAATPTQSDTTPPTVPTGINVGSATAQTLTVTWTASTDNIGVAGYYVYRNGTQVATVTTTSYEDTGLTANTSYRYTVSAYDAAGNVSAQSTAASGSTLAATGFPFATSVSTNKRYLLDQYGSPYLLMGDAPHALIGNISEADANSYFADRQAHGINATWIEMLCNSYTACNSNGTTYDGIAPFTTSGDVSTPNPVYFQKVDDDVNLAAEHGITVFLDPTETGGWINFYVSNGPTKDFAFGEYLGNRYKNFPNIVWQNGNDFQNWSNPTDDAAILAVEEGIKAAGDTHLSTVELDYNLSLSTDDPNWAAQISLNGAYTYYPTYDEVLAGYNTTPTMPVFMQEAHYDGECTGPGGCGTPIVLRRQGYWAMTSGATGQLYGTQYWNFASGWQTGIDTEGANELDLMKNFFASLPWYNLVPNQDHSLVTAGYGTYDSGENGATATDDYVTAAETPDATTAVIYVADTHTITVNMTKLNGNVTAQWFDPTTGNYTAIGTMPDTGTHQFTSPAARSDGTDDWVLLLKSNPDTTPPSVPSNLVAATASSSQINLSWTASTDNVGVAGYNIYRNGTLVGTTTGTTYQDTGLSANTAYSYTVSAYDAAGNVSAQSVSAQATTSVASTPPTAPTNLMASVVSQTQVNLSWTASTDNVGVTGYNIYRSTTAGFTPGTANQIGTSASTTYSDSTVNTGTYYYAVIAFDAAGNSSSPSNQVTVMVADITPPSTPTNLIATAMSSSQVNLSWTASTDNVGVTGYNIYRNGNLVGSSSQTNYSDTGLSANTSYTYTITAFDAAGNLSAQSTSASATTQSIDTSPPTVPTNLSATAVSSSQVNLSWTASTDNVGVTGYDIYSNGALIATTANTTYQNTGLTANTSYSYTVAAYDAAGNVSAQSATASATTPIAAPATPKFVQENYVTPQTVQSTVSIAYTKAQTAGDTNVVVIGFYQNITATVTSVTDNEGNVYQVAAPMTRGKEMSQVIYYAPNIVAAAAGANTVTVKFSTAVNYADQRIVEYSGLATTNAVDGTSSAAGSGTATSSGTVSTTSADDLIFGGGSTANGFTGTSDGSTVRVITSPDTDIVADRNVTTKGSYGFSATQSASSDNDNVTQVVAFRAAGQ